MSLKTWSPSTVLVVVMMALGVLGFTIASYLTILHYTDTAPFCSLVSGCDVVLKSDYSQVFGIPVALFGVVYFVSILVLLGAFLQTHSKRLFELLLFVFAVGAGIGSILLYIQLFVLDAVCQYCLATDTISLILAVLGVFVYSKYIRRMD